VRPDGPRIAHLIETDVLGGAECADLGRGYFGCLVLRPSNK